MMRHHAILGCERYIGVLAALCALFSINGHADEKVTAPDSETVTGAASDAPDFAPGIDTDPARENNAPATADLSTVDEAHLDALLSAPDLPGDIQERSLRETLALAAARNLRLKEMRVTLEKADLRLKQAWGVLVPAAKAEMKYIRADHADTVNMGGLSGIPGAPASAIEVNPANTVTGNLSIGMPLINVSAWKGIQISKKSRGLSALTVAEYRRSVLFGTGKAYFTALMSRSMVDLYKEQILSTAHHLDVAIKKFDAGSGLRIDVLRAGIELERTEKLLSNARLSLASACDALGVLTGQDALVLPARDSDLAAKEVRTEAAKALVDEALAHRLDVASKKAERALSDDRIQAAWMILLPTLSLAWQGSYKFTKPGSLGDTDRSRWNLMLNLTIPLFNYTDLTGITENKLARRQAELQLETLAQSVGQDVRKAHREYLSALSDVESARRQVDLATESLKLTETAFEVGAGTSLEVTDARRTHIEAQLNLMTSELQTQLALINLLEALGKDPLGIGPKG